MNESCPVRQYRWAFAFGAYLLLACGVVLAAERSALPKVVVIGTGGTIAGSAASNTEFHEYKPGKVAIQALIDGISGQRNTADIRSEQLFQVGSASLTSNHWLAVRHRIATSLTPLTVRCAFGDVTAAITEAALVGSRNSSGNFNGERRQDRQAVI